MTDPVYHRSKELLEAAVGDELVGLEPDAGKCFGFNEVATSVWRSLEQPKSFDQLRDLLVGEYDVEEEQCSVELSQLLDELVAKGLIKKSDSPKQA